MSLDPRWADVRRLLVIRLDNIGDVIMLGPALRALKAALPNVHLTLMASPAGSQIVPLLPWVDDVIVERVLSQDISGAWPLDPERELATVDLLRRREFDAALIFTSFTQSPYPPAYACYLAGIPLRIAQSKEFAGGVVSQWVKPLPDDTHQVDRNLHLLESAGFEITGRHLELHIPADAQARADRLLTEAGILLSYMKTGDGKARVHSPSRTPLLADGDAFVALAPGASAESRRYSALRYANVATQLLRKQHPLTGEPLKVVLLGSPREAALVEPILEAAEGLPITSLVGQTSIAEMVAVINRAALVIANNSGPLHMADALRRPMVIMYSGTEYESQWRPRSAPARLLRRSTFCTPCFAFRCRYRMECLDIAPDTVVAEALGLLSLSAQIAPQDKPEGLLFSAPRSLLFSEPRSDG